MHHPLMQVAMTNLSLVRGSRSCNSLRHDIAEITGVPMIALLHAERRMNATGSILPLRELFANPAVPKADRLKYRFGTRQLQRGYLPAALRSMQACRLLLDLESSRGQLQIAIDLQVMMRATATQRARQMLRFTVSYRLVRGNEKHIRRQSMTLSGNRRRPSYPATARAA